MTTENYAELLAQAQAAGFPDVTTAIQAAGGDWSKLPDITIDVYVALKPAAAFATGEVEEISLNMPTKKVTHAQALNAGLWLLMAQTAPDYKPYHPQIAKTSGTVELDSEAAKTGNWN